MRRIELLQACQRRVINAQEIPYDFNRHNKDPTNDIYVKGAEVSLRLEHELMHSDHTTFSSHNFQIEVSVHFLDTLLVDDFVSTYGLEMISNILSIVSILTRWNMMCNKCA
jgi:hypothetical protein